jgi:glucosyl-3-phosphoglycerate phosphatase
VQPAGRRVRGRGGEDPEAVADRAVAALADLPPAPVAVVVTHGGTAGRLVERLLGIGAEHRRVFGALGNCAWSELAVQSGRWRLIRHNSSVFHVPDGRVEGAAAAAPSLRAGPRLPDAGAVPDEGPPPPATDADAVL